MERYAFTLAAALCGFLLTNATLNAQTPAPEPPPPPREGTAEFSFVGTSGNASTSALGLGGEYIVRTAPWLFSGKASYVRNETEDELKAQAFAALLRASRTLSARISAFGEYGYLRDQFAGIESRNTIQGGITYAVLKPKPHQLDVDASLGYAHENRVVGDNLSTAQALFGARYKFVLSETAEISDDLGVSFSLSDADDWRSRNTAALTVKVASIFSLKVSNIVRYVHAPVEGFKTTDTLTSVALVAKF